MSPSFRCTDASQDTQSLKQVWYGVNATSCPQFYNFHLHTTCSDGQLSPLEVMEQAIAIGLQGMAITDHHSVQGFYEAQTWLAQRRSPLHLWTGIEVTAQLMGVDVHLLGYGFNPEAASMMPYVTGDRPPGEWGEAAQVIGAIHRAGGLVVLAHPFRYRRPAAELVLTAVQLGIDGIEVYYAYHNPDPWQPSAQEAEQAREWGAIHGLFTTCGTDTHGRSLLRRI